jgi:hypothetical protein
VLVSPDCLARGPAGAGTGTAWLFDADEHLVTNEHVISRRILAPGPQ